MLYNPHSYIIDCLYCFWSQHLQAAFDKDSSVMEHHNPVAVFQSEVEIMRVMANTWSSFGDFCLENGTQRLENIFQSRAGFWDIFIVAYRYIGFQESRITLFLLRSLTMPALDQPKRREARSSSRSDWNASSLAKNRDQSEQNSSVSQTYWFQ